MRESLFYTLHLYFTLVTITFTVVVETSNSKSFGCCGQNRRKSSL